MKTIHDIFNIIQELKSANNWAGEFLPNYLNHYIGISIDGASRNFIYLKTVNSHSVSLIIPHPEIIGDDILREIENSDISQGNTSQDYYLTIKPDILSKPENIKVLKDILEKSFNEFSSYIVGTTPIILEPKNDKK